MNYQTRFYEEKRIKIIQNVKTDSPFSFNEDIWEAIQKIDNGTFIEDNNKFTIQLTNGMELVFNKNEDLRFTRGANKYFNADIELFDMFEGRDNKLAPTFLLYRFKEEDRRDEFMLSNIFGWWVSSFISFEIL